MLVEKIPLTSIPKTIKLLRRRKEIQENSSHNHQRYRQIFGRALLDGFAIRNLNKPEPLDFFINKQEITTKPSDRKADDFNSYLLSEITSYELEKGMIKGTDKLKLPKLFGKWRGELEELREKHGIKQVTFIKLSFVCKGEKKSLYIFNNDEKKHNQVLSLLNSLLGDVDNDSRLI